ncbi:protein FAM171A2 [Denticeps clupeoides]|uniref:Protein FAM171A2 n=1 Tax=Denticeps clupeoides TaxID=299321 RepID=A0AAY4ART6_9TELE|nr:protein FAM171A2 [Denticeps clupeoides]
MPPPTGPWARGRARGADGGAAVRMAPPRAPRSFFLLFLFFCDARRTLAKSVPDQGPLEVLVKVQLFDNSDLSPLADADVQVFGNQSVLAASRAGNDGVVTVTFLYRPGTWVIVSASKRGFVTNSAPWHASRIPLYASVSLYLLPQKPATLILYDDVVQLLLGSPGAKNQPWVQIQRKGFRLGLNESDLALSAMLTSSRSQYEIGGFPYPLGLENNSTGPNSTWVELMAVAAVCALLSTHNGTTVPVSDPIHISIPLPPDSPLKMATSVPVWRYEDRTGIWVRSGTGYIKKEGSQMTWNFVAPHLGYWLAAFPATAGTALNPSGLRDITTYHTIFLLAILGSMALLVLILLCLLLYYCRRRCLKPRQQHRKTHMSATLESSKRDQGTSTSHLNLISCSHMETISAMGDGDAIKSNLSSTRDLHSSRENFFQNAPSAAQKLRHSRVNTDTITRRGGVESDRESFQMKVARSSNSSNTDPALLRDHYSRNYSSGDDTEERRSHGHLHHHSAKDNQGYSSDPPSPPPLIAPFTGPYQDLGRDVNPPEYSASQPHVSQPGLLNTQPGQLIFCHSMEQMKDSMYRSVVPTLVIPAHYMHLSSELSAVEQAMERQQQLQHDMEGIQVSLTLPRPSGQKQQRQDQQHKPQKDPEGDERGGDGKAMEPNGRDWGSDPTAAPVRIPVLFNESTMAQMNGELQALTENKLLELGVKPHPRAWFVSLDGRSNSLVRHSYIELGSENNLRTAPATASGGLEHRGESRDGKVGLRKGGKEEGRTKEAGERKVHSKLYSKLPVIDSADPPSSSSESHGALYSPEDNSLAPLLDDSSGARGGTFPRRGRSRDNSVRSSASDAHRDSVTSPDEDESYAEDKEDDGENKKSPWQKREERPLMVFNVK